MATAKIRINISADKLFTNSSFLGNVSRLISGPVQIDFKNYPTEPFLSPRDLDCHLM